jgi:hypothetical protein
MLLERTGIRIDLTNPGDIEYHKRLGWTEVKEAAPAAASVTPPEPKPEEVKHGTKQPKAPKKKAGEQ